MSTFPTLVINKARLCVRHGIYSTERAIKGKIRCGRTALASFSSDSPISSLTVEEAGRRAFDRSNADSVRKERLDRLLNAVDHVDESTGGLTRSPGSNLATLLAHAGIESRGTENFPMAPPLHTATTYTRPPDGIYKESDSVYARMDNPTRLLLEKTVFALECSGLPSEIDEPTTLAFSSGMQAVTSVILAHSTANGAKTTVLIPTDVYHGVRSLLSGVFLRHGVEVRELDMVDNEFISGAEVVASEIQDIASTTSTRSNVIVWMETPSNPKCQVVDIKAVCDAANVEQARWKEILDVTTVVDGTMASPVLTRPLELGADISFHSGTKYMGGHSDALIGTLTVSPTTSRGQELFPLLKSVQIAGGGVASPWDCWLTLRGMRTLHVRVEKQCATALAIAKYLAKKMEAGGQQTSTTSGADWMSKVEVTAVHYPGLTSHPEHEIAKRQMVLEGEKSCYGGVLSFELGDEVEATAFCAALKVAQRATSLGGTETLVEHRASIEPPDCVVSPPGLLRVSVGLEHADDLIRDFEEAFGIVEEILTEAKH